MPVSLAFVGATILSVAAPPIDNGVLVIQGDQIVSVGVVGAIDIPEEATQIDVSGQTIIPGLVDLHSHIGGGRLGESLGQTQPGISAIDAIDPSHPSIQRAQAGGITTVNVMPGSGKLMGGQTAYLSLRDVATVDEMLRCHGELGEGPARRTQICGGMKMANGTNPQGDGGDPRSRMGSAFLQRQVLLGAVERMEKVEAAAVPSSRRHPSPDPPEPDIVADALVQILRGERTVHFHSHRADDIVTVLRLKEEFNFALVVHHGSEGFKVAETLVEAGVPVAINVLDTPGGKEETVERRLDNPALLHAAGVTVALITDDPVQDSRLLLRTGGLAVRGGLPESVALAALTHKPAEMMGLGEQIGTLEPGKDADFVVLSGAPFRTWTHVEQTWVAGEMVFDRSDPAQIRYATGGDAIPGEEP